MRPTHHATFTRLDDNTVSVHTTSVDTNEPLELIFSYPVGGGEITGTINGETYDPNWDTFGQLTYVDNITDLLVAVRKEWKRSVTYGGQNIHLDLQWEIKGIDSSIRLQRRSKAKPVLQTPHQKPDTFFIVVVGVIFLGGAIVLGMAGVEFP